MSMLPFVLVVLATAFSLMSLGGGIYEVLVVDASWPRRPDLIQPQRGGISRKRFWFPMHTAFELLLIASLIAAWSEPTVRTALLVAVISHAAMRLWSAFDFIPKALEFERTDPATIAEEAARRWIRRSRTRLPLDLVTCSAMLSALVAAVRLG